MKNPFLKKKKSSSIMRSVINSGNNTITGPISGLPSTLQTIVIRNSGNVGIGVQGEIGRAHV